LKETPLYLKPLKPTTPVDPVHGTRIILTFFKQNTEIWNFTLCQVFRFKIRICLECPNPVDQFSGCGSFFNSIEVAKPIKVAMVF